MKTWWNKARGYPHTVNFGLEIEDVIGKIVVGERLV